MPKIKTELIKLPKEGQELKIVKVEETTIETPKGEFDAYRVEMKSNNAKDTSVYSVSLWASASAGSQSKLGSFLDAFQMYFKGEKDAYDTDTWIGHTIKFNTWQDKNRDIEVIK